MGLYAIKPAFREFLKGAALPAASRVHPDVLTLAAVGVSGAAGALYWRAGDRPWALFTITGLLFIRLALNALDGMVAQARGLARPAGELLNEMCDRVSDILIFGGLAWSGVANRDLALGALIMALLVSTLGILGKAVGGGREYGGWLGKADRMVWLMLGNAWVAGLLLAGIPERTVDPMQDPIKWVLWMDVRTLNPVLALFAPLGLATLWTRWRTILDGLRRGRI